MGAILYQVRQSFAESFSACQWFGLGSIAYFKPDVSMADAIMFDQKRHPSLCADHFEHTNEAPALTRRLPMGGEDQIIDYNER